MNQWISGMPHIRCGQTTHPNNDGNYGWRRKEEGGEEGQKGGDPLHGP